MSEINVKPDILDESCKTNIEDYLCCICQSIPNPETIASNYIIFLWCKKIFNQQFQ